MKTLERIACITWAILSTNFSFLFFLSFFSFSWAAGGGRREFVWIISKYSLWDVNLFFDYSATLLVTVVFSLLLFKIEFTTTEVVVIFLVEKSYDMKNCKYHSSNSLFLFFFFFVCLTLNYFEMSISFWWNYGVSDAVLSFSGNLQ